MSGEGREAEVIRSESQIGYSYATIRLTQSRIDKGLIAVPTALAEWFPDHNADIQVYLGDSPVLQSKRYSSFNSSTKECRIGGVKRWLEERNLRSGDEIVVQVIDRKNLIYRLLPERDFVAGTQALRSSFDSSSSEFEASERLLRISEWANTKNADAALSEYRRLAATSTPDARRVAPKRQSRSRESVPANLRTLLRQLYQGHCQVCDFWFFKKNNEPYFEVHHLDAMRGHHPKNLLVVCGNCHNQFEHAKVTQEFDSEHWLVNVGFNGLLCPVNQITLTTRLSGFRKELFL